MKTYYSERTAGVPGTLFNIKEYAGHKQVKFKVLDNFKHVWDLLELNINICNNFTNCNMVVYIQSVLVILVLFSY